MRGMRNQQPLPSLNPQSTFGGMPHQSMPPMAPPMHAPPNQQSQYPHTGPFAQQGQYVQSMSLPNRSVYQSFEGEANPASSQFNYSGPPAQPQFFQGGPASPPQYSYGGAPAPPQLYAGGGPMPQQSYSRGPQAPPQFSTESNQTPIQNLRDGFNQQSPRPNFTNNLASGQQQPSRRRAAKGGGRPFGGISFDT